MKFSIIVPVHNPDPELFRANQLSALSQKDKELLVIDDCSDNWYAEKHSILPLGHPHKTDKNRGPGAARNVGLDNAKGDWIVFLDSDDELLPDALNKLAAFIDAHPDVDAIGYGWEFSHQQGVNQRKDGHCLDWPKADLLKEYLKLRMDGSVIYTAVKRSLIEEHGLRFRDGVHEDIDFIYKVYAHANKAVYLPAILYRKTQRRGSIVNTMTRAHIDGFVDGWMAVGAFRLQDGLGANSHSAYKDAYQNGVIGAIATRVREVMYKAENQSLLRYLLDTLPESWIDIVRDTNLTTQYAQIAKRFIFTDYMVDPALFTKTWGCHDLHNSLFLAPDEIRACCKRFFVDGEMRGDVVLVKAQDASVMAITAAKQQLLSEINKGEKTPCAGCPFLEFKNWGSVTPLRVKHLSMEHHSVCNMKCAYCDEKYYGKKQPEYDVLGLLRELYKFDAFVGCESIVWGGGEPVLGKRFADMVASLTEMTTAKHRFLTNSTVFSPAIANSIRSGRGTVTTSFDAGTEAKFFEVRGLDVDNGMLRAMDNVLAYADINSQAVTIKYIMTDDNIEYSELTVFSNKMREHNLINCNFQISCDFKKPEAFGQLLAAMRLFALLREAGCLIVFFDDLLMQRIVRKGIGVKGADWMRKNYVDVRAWPEDHPRVTIWGVGGMTDWAISQTDFFQSGVEIVARNRHVAGTPAVITGSQGYADNYRKALAAGVPEDMIVKGLIL